MFDCYHMCTLERCATGTPCIRSTIVSLYILFEVSNPVEALEQAPPGLLLLAKVNDLGSPQVSTMNASSKCRELG